MNYDSKMYALSLKKVINSLALPTLGEFSTRDYDLWFSPDEDAWYWQRDSDGKASQLFDDNLGAIEAMKLELASPGIIKWD